MKKLLLILTLLFLVACTPRLYEVTQTENIMGTFISITIYDEDKNKANLAIQDVYTEFRRIDSLLSSYKNDSELTKLNNEKIIQDYSQDLLLNIQKSEYYGELSNGAFDITVQPILDLYKESFAQGGPPTDSEIKKTLKKVNYKQIEVESNYISLGNNQKITLGGIAKGYAVDKSIEILEKNGIKHALVNAGGDMRALGKKYGSINWQIALSNPRNKDEFIEIIPIANKAIVTSGDYERYFDENKDFHHIVNPLTGYSATELISVTIIANNAFDADAISTAVFVMGKGGIDLIESLEDVEGLIITKDKEIIKSGGFQ